MIMITGVGPLALIEDLGRPGYTQYGVPVAGAADRAALRAANRLTGNPEDSAGIEILLGGLEISTDHPAWCAVAGPATTTTVNGRPTSSHQPLHLSPGDRLTVLPSPDGIRNYLAVRGGFDVPAVLGSRSADLLSGLGPPPLRVGDRLPVGSASLPFAAADVSPPPRPPVTPALIGIEPGPRADWFTEEALTSLVEQRWTVTPDSDRTAVRLDGEPLRRRTDQPAELPSEGIIRGAIQVPPSGLPLIFGSNHPVTGGYPVIAVVTPDGCDRAAQLRPGDTLRLTP
ncbi:5-oxoprolinase subunit C family protein [Microlunatus soli]|uniref:Biotin-dependent carboxylase uncharacterized domain-containing protein n=1 Tax=Microlunatus soli TaxID=630515 RepID=A0A1H1X7U5_9ACTN|nr:biotin-dependent carboxyltransferase family protein [Microlunatus soli]SDT05121.1 biotin-dependent carboxylase uncharacterized domain-containing protein [Microlunatus soli]